MTHHNTRLEAVCDGVFAIAMTLLIIELKLPPLPEETTSAEVWRALGHVVPHALAFLLSFTIIFITWVNHHAAMKLVAGTSAPFIYANGFLLLAVVALPFPTKLLGEFLGTDHAGPAVALYNGVLVLTAIGWVLVATAGLSGNLPRDEAATTTTREARRNGYFAVGLYALLALLAIWFPMTSFVLTTVTWLFWLIMGIRMKHVV
jgi:uncharacterized membrane protein